MPQESRLIPDPMRAEVKVQIQLPPEATALMCDLHRDREAIGTGGVVLLACAVALTLKRVLSKR